MACSTSIAPGRSYLPPETLTFVDIFDLHNVKAEKSYAMLLYRRLRDIAKLFRLAELCFLLVLLSWTSARLPFAVRISGEYFRYLISVVVSPLFIFLLGNVIVLILLAKSGELTVDSSASNNDEADLYEELMRAGENGMSTGPDGSPPVPEPEEIVYQDKQMICEVNLNTSVTTTATKNCDEISCDDTIVADNAKAYRRSQSENLKKPPCEKLRRSETDICRKVSDSGERPPEAAEMVDHLSNEEFKRTIEAFIAKQVRFHKEEKLAIVVRSQT
ncbi:hypothetical protein RJ639_015639 [Escallonia herrerae]|uniref:DUF4408 domain-containing protein n=1 Tax=Escallonia herrerae TaxID=1293975 RepID=A0AA88VCJ2_9ASTE|nr:hypothetical protein RJ639_015639 [Escallonia herrerae]